MRIAIGEPMGPGDEVREEIRFVGGRIRPFGLARTISESRLAFVRAILVHGQHELIDRRVAAIGSTFTVVEHQYVSFAWQALGYPVRIVLAEQPLIGIGAVAVSLR